MKKKIVMVISLLFITSLIPACSKYIRNRVPYFNISRIYPVDYDSAWKATVDSLSHETIVTANKDDGVIITKWAIGSSPEYLYKNRLPFFQKEKTFGIGATVADLTPRIVYVAHIEEGDPADKAGIHILDVFLDVNGEPVKEAADYYRILRAKPEEMIIKLLRRGENKPITVHAKPRVISRSYTLRPVITRYKLNVKVTRVSEMRTEVRILSSVKGQLNVKERSGWRTGDQYSRPVNIETLSAYKDMESSTFRESVILDEIGRRLAPR